MPDTTGPMRGLWTPRDFNSVTRPVALLIIDDDEALTAALGAAFTAHGYRALAVHGGAAAFQVPQAWTPHVVILDIEMPICDGFCVAAALRGSTRFASVPILAHSSLVEGEVKERGIAAGIDAFYRKGEPLHGLFEMIDHLAPVRYL